MSAPALKKGIVKQVLSADSIIIRGYPKNGPPPEKQITFSNVTGPKLARRPGGGSTEDSRDEPWAWEARECLRKKLVGEEVSFYSERPANSTREYGVVYLAKGGDPTGINLTEFMVSEGFLTVRKEGNRNAPELARLIELEEAAKAAGKGKWSESPASEHIRNVKWTQENPSTFVEKCSYKPIPAIIEHVRDGSTVRAFLLPEFQYITLMISGIRCPGFKLDGEGKPLPNDPVPFAEEARFFVESRLLQRDVEIVLESANNANFVGSILFPKGNIAEALLREGFAKCVDWSMAFMKTGADKLRAAEKQAKLNRLRLWKDYQSNAQNFTGKEKDFTGTVTEILNADCIMVKTTNGVAKKVFLSSIRPPREANKAVEEGKPAPPRPKNFRPLYDIPYMFDARETLRKKLIGKKVQCTLDYISPARDNFPEKYCYTVLQGSSNIAENLVSKGLAKVVRHRQDDDQRSSKYEDLLTAEAQAQSQHKGMHANKEPQPIRLMDLTVDHSKLKQLVPSWQRALRFDAIVEFVASGSRFRVFLPKDSCLVTFLLAGISCPRSSRPAANGQPAQEGEPFGDEALSFSKEKILQKDVSIHVDATDKNATSVIGWLWVNNVNLSIALVEEGLASVHFSAEKSEYYRQLKTAEDGAKAKKKNIWANYVEEVEEKHDEEKEDKEVTGPVDRKINHETVVITEITPELRFFAQHVDQGSKLAALMSKLRQEFQVSPPPAGAYTPKRGDLCAAKFSMDNEWYRAKIEKVQGNNVSINYIDYGNKEVVPPSRLANLPPAFTSDKPYASEFGLALGQLPPDEDDKADAIEAFRQDALDAQVLLNIEYRVNNFPYASLTNPTTNADIGKALITDGILLCEKRRERRIQKLIEDYKAEEEAAKKKRMGVWKYGDITEDDAKEFGR